MVAGYQQELEMFCAMDKAIKRWGEHATDGEPRKFARRGEGPTAENSNIAENYTWKAQNKKIQCRADLIKIANDCKRDGVPLRVLASGWSCNRFIDPTPSKDGGKALGVNIELCGELAVVGEMTDTTITAMAGTMRGPIYAVTLTLTLTLTLTP